MHAIGFDRHNHARCIRAAIDAADAHCRAKGLRLTPVRRRVLEILLEEHRALGAYEILEILAREGFGTQPPVAYRALDFLVSGGLAHRVERLNAFVACAHPEAPHAPALLVCRACHAVAEAEAPAQRGDALDRAAAETGFVIERAVIEAEGLCPACLEADPA